MHVEKYFLMNKAIQNVYNKACKGMLAIGVVVLSSCATDFNRVYKMTDNNYKYEFAKECFALGKYGQAETLLMDLVTYQKGTENAEECLYMLAMTQFANRDYDNASMTFKKYCTSYPKGMFAERAYYYQGLALYNGTPEPRLDQSLTVSAINAMQQFLDLYPESDLREDAQQKLFDLQEKLVVKELLSARLYYNLGGYFGNCIGGGSNYEACIITSQNAMKTYPYNSHREDFALLIMKSKFELAEQSVEQKRMERYHDAEDECYGFINEFPESKNRQLAEKFIVRCKRYTKDYKEEL